MPPASSRPTNAASRVFILTFGLIGAEGVVAASTMLTSPGRLSLFCVFCSMNTAAAVLAMLLASAGSASSTDSLRSCVSVTTLTLIFAASWSRLSGSVQPVDHLLKHRPLFDELLVSAREPLAGEDVVVGDGARDLRLVHEESGGGAIDGGQVFC